MPRDYAYYLVCAATLAGVVIACLDSNDTPPRVPVSAPAIVAAQPAAPVVAPAIAAPEHAVAAAAAKASRREQRLAHRAARRTLERANAAVANPAKAS